MILSTKRFLCMNVPHLQCPFPSPSLRWSLPMLHSITAVLPGNLRFFEDPFPLSDNQFCSSAESSELQFVLCFCLLSVLWMPEGKNCIFFFKFFLTIEHCTQHLALCLGQSELVVYVDTTHAAERFLFQCFPKHFPLSPVFLYHD